MFETESASQIPFVRPTVPGWFSTRQGQEGQVYQIDPGHYRLTRLSEDKASYGFGFKNSPVEFDASAGEVLYLGNLYFKQEETLSYGLLQARKEEYSLTVGNDFDAIRDAVTRNLAVLPQAAPVQTRLLTILKSPLIMTGRKVGF
jgi:hypothetical protein